MKNAFYFLMLIYIHVFLATQHTTVCLDIRNSHVDFTTDILWTEEL